MFLVGAHLLAACFFAFALYGILRADLVKQTSGDAIFGAVCGYLLLGIIWSLYTRPWRRLRPDPSLLGVAENANGCCDGDRGT